MGIGDNFDTSSGGLVNQKTGRYSGKALVGDFFKDGSHETNMLEHFYNGGHPCNIGCGCHSVCEPYTTSMSGDSSCYLPEELLISVVQDGTNRHSARAKIGSLGYGNDTFFLKYHNGAWRGRKSCHPLTEQDSESGISAGSGPCDVTTIEIGSNGQVERSNCNYSGTKGVYDPIDIKAVENERRTNKQNLLLDIHGHWVYEGRHTDQDVRFANCLRDGEIAPRLRSRCMTIDPFGDLIEHYCGGYCEDENADKTNQNEEDCKADDNTWINVSCSEAECVIASKCDGELSEECDDRCKDLDRGECLGETECGWNGKNKTCFSLNKRVSEWECIACGGDWYPKWVAGDYDASACCGKSVITDNSPNHQPDLTGAGQEAGGYGLTKEKTQGTCITPYREAILIPGSQNLANAGAILGGEAPCTAIQNALERTDIGGDGLTGGNYFTLILRGCDYYGDCADRPTTLSAESRSHKVGAAGLETVLFIPVDQMLNCSDFDLTVKTPIAGAKGSADGKWGAAKWMDSRGDVDGNIAGFYPGTYNYGATDSYGLSPYTKWCSREDWNLDGDADYNTQCGKYVYYESGYINGFNRIDNPKGHYGLRAFNIHPQPFKATEQEQETHKTLDEAQYDSGQFGGCIDSGYDYALCMSICKPDESSCAGKDENNCAGDACIWDGSACVGNCDAACRGGLIGAGGGCAWDMTHGWDFWFRNDFKYDGTLSINDVGGLCERIGGDVFDWVQGRYGQLECGNQCNVASADTGSPRWKVWYPFESPTGCMEDAVDETGGPKVVYVTRKECSERGMCVDKSTDPATKTGEDKTDCEANGNSFIPCGWCPGPFTCLPGECISERPDGPVVVPGITSRNACEALGNSWLDPNPVDGLCPCADHDNPSDCNSESCKWEGGDGSDDEGNPAQGSCVDLGMCGCNPPPECIDAIELPHELQDLIYGFSHNGVKAVQARKNADGEEVDSLKYWGRTGLYPNKYEPGISHVADSCVGTSRSGRVEMASNTKPAIIRSKKHLLKNGDKIEIEGVMGNFKVNRMTNRDWTEMLWEDKTAKECKGDHCDKQINPTVKCPEEEDKTCNYKVEFSDGSSVESCYPGKDEKGNPLPAPWVVVEKYDEDNFKLYTCDGEPLDARVDASGFASCNPLETGKKVCGSHVATQDGLRPTCPCNTVTGTGTSSTITEIPEVLLDKEEACIAYGECVIVSGGNIPGTTPLAIMSLEDCEKLASVYVEYDEENGHSYADPIGNIYNPCVSTGTTVDTTECWNQLSWDRENNFQTGGDGDPDDSAAGVNSYVTCPYTGVWSISRETINDSPYDHSRNVYRDGWDGTGVARFDLPSMSDNYYVQIEQKENCPVCADHFMPKDLVATIHPQDTSIFRILKSGFSRCNRTASGGLKSFADGHTCNVFQNTFCGEEGTASAACLQDCHENTDESKLSSGVCLTEYCQRQCCDDCALHPIKATKQRSPILSANPGQLVDPCCDCECTGHANWVGGGGACRDACPEYPTIEEFVEHCGGCGHDGSWVNHPAGGDRMRCRMVSDMYTCSPTDDATLDQMIICSSGGANPQDTDGDGIPDKCFNNMTGQEAVNCEAYPMGGHCECVPCTGYVNGRHDMCEGDFVGCKDQFSQRGDGAWCEQACMKTGRYNKDLDDWGRDNGLPATCAAANNIITCNLEKGCEWVLATGTCVAQSKPGSPTGACPMAGTATGIDCYETQLGVRAGCPGLSTVDVPLVYNGGYWASDWILMGERDGEYVGGMIPTEIEGGGSDENGDPVPEQRKPILGNNSWGFSCSHHYWPSCCLKEGTCIDGCGNKAYGDPPSGMTIKEWCVENGHTFHPSRNIETCYECDCGSCSQMNDDRDWGTKKGGWGHEGPPKLLGGAPIPVPGKDGHFARFNLACANGAPVPGDGIAMSGNARFNLTGDYYHNNQLDLSWEITTCAFPSCGSESYKPPCPEEDKFGCTSCENIKRGEDGSDDEGNPVKQTTPCVNKHGGCGKSNCGNCVSQPTIDCDGTPPCIECCSISTDGYETCPTQGIPPHDSRTFPTCFGSALEIADMYPDWWYEGENMTVYHVDMDTLELNEDDIMERVRGYDVLTVQLSDSKCCSGGPPNWPAGYCTKSTEEEEYKTEKECNDQDGVWHPTYVSTGRADRVEAELGSRTDYSRNNTSKNPVMGLGRTELMETIPLGGDRHHSGFWAVKVKDASLLRTGNAALDRHLQRRSYMAGAGVGDSVFSGARFRHVDGGFVREEPYPYGLSPWPVPHQK